MGESNTKNRISDTQVIERRIKVIHEVFTITFIVFYLFLCFSVFYSTWAVETRIKNWLIGTVVIAVIYGLLFVNRRVIKNKTLQLYIYFFMITLFTFATFFVNIDKHVLSIIPIIFFGLVICFITFNKRIILYYSIIIIGMMLYFMVSSREVTVVFGTSYIMNSVVLALMSLYGYIRTIILVNWFEYNLKSEIEEVQKKNIELEVLNETYQTTTEELYAQYEQVGKLNETAQLYTERLDTIYESSDEGIIEYVVDKDVYLCTNRAQELLEYTVKKSAYQLEDITKHMSSESKESFTELWRKLLAGEISRVELAATFEFSSDPNYYNIKLISYRSKIENKEHILIIIKDNTNEIRQEKHIYNLAFYDKLTGLYSRNGFCEKLDSAIKSGYNNFYLMLFDVDNFKYINDTFGYKVGDGMLRLVAESLTVYGEKDLPVGRVESDNFALVVDGTTNIDRLIMNINTEKAKFIFEETEFSFNYSIGVSRYRPGVDASDLLINAEIAMYKVKERGKNSYAFFESYLINEFHDKLIMTNALEKAIGLGEIVMNYQPFIRSVDGSLYGFEALVRWNSETLGMIPPLEFINLAEQTGYIYELGGYIIDQVCKTVNKMVDKGFTQRVSINVSSKQLTHHMFVKDFVDILKENNTKPENIAIELTETALINQMDYTVTVMKQLRDIGIKVYLDDFGKGYSSLTYLKRLPLDVIKIDKSFIDNIHTHDQEKNLVKSIINLAKNYNLEIIAEGIELDVQYEILKQLDCDILQGYYFDRPMAEDKALKRLD